MKNRKNFRFIFPILVTGMLLFGGYQSRQNIEHQIKLENQKVSSFKESTIDRVNNSVITLPEGDTIVGVKNGIGFFPPDENLRGGSVKMLTKYLVSNIIEKTKKTNTARLDVFVPMAVEGDSNGSSLYVILFHDRGDAVIEKSHVRLGGASVVVERISILSKDENNPLEEYRVKINYFHEGLDPVSGILKVIQKEIVVPVADGHFVD